MLTYNEISDAVEKLLKASKKLYRHNIVVTMTGLQNLDDLVISFIIINHRSERYTSGRADLENEFINELNANYTTDLDTYTNISSIMNAGGEAVLLTELHFNPIQNNVYNCHKLTGLEVFLGEEGLYGEYSSISTAILDEIVDIVTEI